MRYVAIAFILYPIAVTAQSGPILPDATKLAPIYQQQRNFEADKGAQCYAVAADLQTRVVDLEKQLAEAKATQSKENK